MAYAAVELKDAQERLAPKGKPPKVPTAEDIQRALELIHRVLSKLEPAEGGVLGVPVSVAADYLAVSEPTVRSWIERGVLAEVPDSRPKQVDASSLRRVSRAVFELRERGQDKEWLQALVDLLHDRAHVQSDEVTDGLGELARGELEPA